MSTCCLCCLVFLGVAAVQQLGKERCWLVGWKTLEKKTCRIGLHVHAVHVLPLERIVSMAMNCMAASSILMHLMYSTSMYKKYIYIYIQPVLEFGPLPIKLVPLVPKIYAFQTCAAHGLLLDKILFAIPHKNRNFLSMTCKITAILKFANDIRK